MALTSPIGHSDQRALFKRILINGKLPQATLLAGSTGIGKKTVAHELIRSIFCETCRQMIENGDGRSGKFPYGGCGVCKHCKLFDVHNLPDFLERDCSVKEEGNVSGVRELLYSLHLKPFQGNIRIVLLDNAEYLNVQGANALLKSLEEPRPGTFYFLVCENPYRLPDTVLSRCQAWHFDDLTVGQLKELISDVPELKQLISDQDVSLDELCLIADGSLENLHELSSHLQFWRDLRNNLTSIATGNLQLAVQCAGEITKDKDSLRSQLRIVRGVARHEMHQRAASGESHAWAGLLFDVITAEKLIFERNLNASQVVTTVLLRLANGTGGGSFTSSGDDVTFLEQQLLA